MRLRIVIVILFLMVIGVMGVQFSTLFGVCPPETIGMCMGPIGTRMLGWNINWDFLLSYGSLLLFSLIIGTALYGISAWVHPQSSRRRMAFAVLTCEVTYIIFGIALLADYMGRVY